NITKGAELIEKHVSENNKFCLIGHVDMDSLFSNSIAYMWLKELNPELEVVVLDPKVKAQGFNKDIMERLEEVKPGIVWCTDAGSSDVEQVKLLHEKGIDVIITDHHHKVEDSDIENYCAFINNQHSSNVENKYGSGTLVTWKLMQHVDWSCGINDSDKYIDIVALSLFSDVCNTTSLENRAVIYYGLKHIYNPFIIELLTKLSVNKSPVTWADDWGWNVNPQLNGSIKLGYFKELFEGLTNPSEPTEWEQGKVRITKKKGNNLERALYIVRNKGKEKKPLVKEIFANLDNENNKNEKIVMVFDDGSTHKFLGGDVASEFSRVYNKPTIMFMKSDDEYYGGSVRSPFGVKSMLESSGLFEFVAGHDSAHGHRIRKDRIEQLKEYINSTELS
ncbi:MAG: DHH family phosphoesterase, partial [Bacteroidales bacterium]